MKTYAMALDLIDESDVIEEYKRYHRNVWPEVKDGLSQIGVEEMKIFLLGDRLFMVLRVVEGFKLEKDFQKYTESSSKAKEWDQLMRQFQRKVTGVAEDVWWAPMEEVFDLNW